MSDGGLVGVRADHRRSHVQGKGFRVGSRKSSGADSKRCGRADVLLGERGTACTGEEHPGGSGANLDAPGLFGAESVAAKNGRANGRLGGANMGAIGVHDCAERRGRSGPDRPGQERKRDEQGEDVFCNR